MVEFLSKVENINMDYTPESKIVINERTGTIIAGVDIEVKPVVITQGDITIKIKPSAQAESPAGAVKLDNDLVIGLNQNEVYTKTGTTTVANIVRSLQKLGATPKAIISILEAMKSAGSISAELEVI
jgi:flagellar P-ring protein precursor FlgI